MHTKRGSGLVGRCGCGEFQTGTDVVCTTSTPLVPTPARHSDIDTTNAQIRGRPVVVSSCFPIQAAQIIVIISCIFVVERARPPGVSCTLATGVNQCNLLYVCSLIPYSMRYVGSVVSSRYDLAYVQRASSSSSSTTKQHDLYNHWGTKRSTCILEWSVSLLTTFVLDVYLQLSRVV